MREMQILNGRPAIVGVEGTDTHTDTSGSLSPPNSLSPPPTAPVKLPTTHQLPTAAHPAAQPTMTPTLITHPALRGLSKCLCHHFLYLLFIFVFIPNKLILNFNPSLHKIKTFPLNLQTS